MSELSTAAQPADAITEHQFRAVGLKQALELKKKLSIVRSLRGAKSTPLGHLPRTLTRTPTNRLWHVHNHQDIVSSSQLQVVDEEEQRRLREELAEEAPEYAKCVELEGRNEQCGGDWFCAIEAAIKETTL